MPHAAVEQHCYGTSRVIAQEEYGQPDRVNVMVCFLFRATVDAVARRLRGKDLAVAAYHAALPAATRADVLLQWRAGQLQVVVASVAFGMGVDKGVLYNFQASTYSFLCHSTALQARASLCTQCVQGLA